MLRETYLRACELVKGILEHDELVTLKSHEIDDLVWTFDVESHPDPEIRNKAMHLRERLIYKAQIESALFDAMLKGYAGA